MTGTIITLTMNPAVDVSAATEAVVPTDKLRCHGVKRDPGGGGINVARVISRFGGPCCAVYPAGGASGRMLRDLLQDERIESFAIEVGADTRENFSISEQRSGAQYRFVLSGEALQPPEWGACIEAVVARAETGHYVVASGSLPAGVPDDLYARLADRLTGKGVRLIVDSSGPVLAESLRAGVFLVKPNLQELCGLVGRPLERREDWEAAAQQLVDSGQAEIVVLTLGADGAFLVAEGIRLRAAGIPVDAVSAVGAGDSFLAGMVSRFAAGDSLEESFRYAVAAGSAALLTPGTDLCHAADVERLCAEVRLKRVSGS